MPSLLEKLKSRFFKEHKDLGSSTYDDGETDGKDGFGYRKSTDELPSFQNDLVRHVNVHSARDRFIQLKQNIVIWQHTYGLVDLLLNKPPKYFMYVAPDFNLDDVVELTRLDHVHRKWQKDGMYETLKNGFSQGLAINMACIVRFGNPNNPQWLVFNSSHIKDNHIERDPKTLEIKSIEFYYHGSGMGFAAGSGFKTRLEPRTVTALIGINSVIIQPNPTVDNPLGQSDITKIWAMAVFKALNRYYAMTFNKKGGVGSRVLIAPDSIKNTNAQKRFEQEAKKGLESELIELLYPIALANNPQIDPSKVVQWIENKAGNVDFTKLDGMLAKDSPLPPSFSEGPASGALGGVAPKEDMKKINRNMIAYVTKLTKAIHDINETFYGIRERNYAILPFLNAEGGEEIDADVDAEVESTDKEDPKKEDKEDKKDEPKKEEKEDKKDKKLRRYNSSNGTMSLKRDTKKYSDDVQSISYLGNLFHSGTYTYQYYDWWDDEIKDRTEIMSADALREMIDNPLKLHEGYIDIEHEATFGGNIEYQNAIAKIQILGYEDQDDGSVKDVSKITFKNEWDPKSTEIKLSASFSHGIEEIDGDVYQTDMDMKGGALVHFSMSEANDLSTIAVREDNDT